MALSLSIGIDFDNTIACYDGVFYRLALQQGLIPPDLPGSKNDVRDYLHRSGREDAWAKLQGYVYGPGMAQVEPFPGMIAFLAECRERGIPVSIVSHRTRYPF